MQAVILAGGLGTRMRPFTEKAPKCLLPVHGRPFVDYQLDLLQGGGINDVVLCVGHMGEMVESHVGDGSSRGMQIKYSWDIPDFLGTAGALKRAESLLAPSFFLTWGDSYVRVNHRQMMDAHLAAVPGIVATMGVFANKNAYDVSNVELHGAKVACYAKNINDPKLTFIDAGVSIFERAAIAEIPPNQNLALDQYFSRWAQAGHLGAFQVKDRFFEVGSWSGLADFEAFIPKPDGGVLE